MAEEAPQVLKTYCFDCHGYGSKEGGLNLAELMQHDNFDGTLIFENLATSVMPPKDADQPSPDQKLAVLEWLATKAEASKPNSFRRLSRFEFVNSANDLLGIKLNLAERIPEDRGTSDFDSDRRIQLSKEVLSGYFAMADEMLDDAFPGEGFADELIWVTNKLRDSHHTYDIYVRDYKDGVLFSWTRANNGNSYSFFYDNFEPPVSGWYELTFDAAKVGDFPEDISIQVHAGKYYYADDRPQPQRLLDVISVGNREPQAYTTGALLYPGENISVHCYSQHTFRNKAPEQGAYIRQLQIRGPLQAQWPPTSFQTVFADLPIHAPSRKTTSRGGFQSNLQRIGGSLSVSSFQRGMEKERMQDGSNKTFWHTRFKPTLAEPPHYVILENPRGVGIEGLSYATWSGGNGNGQVKKFSISVSDDGETWSAPIIEGDLEIRLANEQPILFPQKIKKRFIRFLVVDAMTLDGRSLASIGKLDVIVPRQNELPRTRVSVTTNSRADLKNVIRRFANRTFSAALSNDELAPYYCWKSSAALKSIS